MKIIVTALALAMTSTAVSAADFDEIFPNHPGYDQAEINQILRSFDYRQGTIVLPGGQAELTVPDGFYYLGPEDAGAVLSDLWGNLQSETLGMIFPAEYTPWDVESWGAEFQFDPIGYVSDDDAEGYDYDSLLVDMQADTRRESRDRVAGGYEAVELVGWAEPPSYDAVERKLHWAMELKFEGSNENSLNYELRALGREGVLSANFIGSISQLSQIKAGLPAVAEMVNFVEGKSYADFDPSIDTVAAVGIAGLIAGKVLVGKGGIMLAGLILLKKFWFILLLPVFWAKNLFRRNSS